MLYKIEWYSKHTRRFGTLQRTYDTVEEALEKVTAMNNDKSLFVEYYVVPAV